MAQRLLTASAGLADTEGQARAVHHRRADALSNVCMTGITVGSGQGMVHG